mmetsp:Transcript_25836/g.36082  ORF Transcript_25836/g.36082 Transcript_25836/m.36082 type:complete len:150 (-) Transcript_25836:411-860(-)
MQRQELLEKITATKGKLEKILVSFHNPAHPTIAVASTQTDSSSAPSSSSPSCTTLSKTLPPSTSSSSLSKDSGSVEAKRAALSSCASLSYDECVRQVAALLEEDKFGIRQVHYKDGSSSHDGYGRNGHKNRRRKRAEGGKEVRGGDRTK